MEVESPGYGGIISGYGGIVSVIWRNSLRDREVGPPGYGIRVSGMWRYNIRDMEV